MPEIRYMHDQRIEMRAPFGCEYAGDGLAIGRVGAQPVDGFGRESDKMAGANVLTRVTQGRHVRISDDRCKKPFGRFAIAGIRHTLEIQHL